MIYNSTLLSFLFFLRFSVNLSSADTHSLQFLYTVNRQGIGEGLLDGEQFVYYDSNIGRMILKTEWIHKTRYNIGYNWESWNRVASNMEFHQYQFHGIETSVSRSFNQTEGGHVLQMMYGCQLADDNSTTSYLKFGYNGEDFFHVDLKNRTWTADNLQAEIFIKDWDPDGFLPKYSKGLLEKNCFDWLMNYINYSKDRKVRPEVSLFQSNSSSPEVVCHATGFFPKALNITWQRDREDVYEDVELSETLPNHDGSFQKRSVLKVSAEELQEHKYTCVIQHSSLEEDLVLPVSERRILRDGESAGKSDEEPGGGSDANKTGIIVGVVVALFVLVFVIAGFVIWKKLLSKSRENNVI